MQIINRGVVNMTVVNMTIKRIENARIAAVIAKSQWFKDYWNDVANKLEHKLRSGHGQLD